MSKHIPEWGRELTMLDDRVVCEECGHNDGTVTATRWGRNLCINCSYSEIGAERYTEGYTPFGDE